MRRHVLSRLSLLLCCLVISEVPLVGGDWPMWRHDAGRSASSSESLAPSLYRQWTRHLPQLQGAWLDQDSLTVDSVYQPIAADGRLYVGSSHDDSLVAWDLSDGHQLWKFFAEAPIRYAPVAAKGQVYFVADDGCLYCLDGRTGRLRWKVNGAPGPLRVLGNGRLISAWPARGAPVLLDGQVYFAASIWPFMGIFIHAVDAETGQITWTNDGTGSLYMLQPHNSPAFAGLAPQGYLAAAGDALLVPNGRSVPARLNRKTGALEYFHLSKFRSDGGDQVAAAGQIFFNGPIGYDLETGTGNTKIGTKHPPIFSDGIAYTGGNSLRAWNIGSPVISATANRKGAAVTKMSFERVWSVRIPSRLFLKAGERLYGARSGKLIGIDLPREGQPAAVSWSVPLEGTVARGTVVGMIAASGRLIVVTSGGAISCYGARKVEIPLEYPVISRVEMDQTSPAARRATQLLETTGDRRGIAVVIGLEDGQLVEGLALHGLQVIGVDADPVRITAIRRRLDSAGIPRARAAVHVGDPLTFGFPPYLASLITSEQLTSSGFTDTDRFVQQVFRVLRPYGGIAAFGLSMTNQRRLVEAVDRAVAADLLKDPTKPINWTQAGSRVTRAGDLGLLERLGPLPGAGSWTHQYADVGNSSVSRDTRIRAPLGLLWFGGSSNKKILPRHGHGPTEQVVGGRLFIEGPNLIRAVDVYTGRVLWEKTLPGVGEVFNYTGHQPGANATGSNYVSVEDGVYVAYLSKCVRLDPNTGKILGQFPLPPLLNGRRPQWGYIGVWDDLLIAGAAPLAIEGKRVGSQTHDGTTSRWLVVMDRYNGRVLWTREARYAFRHNAISVGNGQLYTIDRLPDTIVQLMARRGRKPSGSPQLLALDARTGQETWSTTQNIFGTWLGYSEEHDLLLHCGRPARDMLIDEPSQRMITYRGDTGGVVWDKLISYDGPCLLSDTTIFTQSAAFSLLTGEVINRTNPLTGLEEPWQFTRNYGCNPVVASRHLLTFRSAAAGFFDLAGDSGTGNLGGFRSSCTSNLICADGVLNAPDYTRTCNCSYQNQASLALVHMPGLEMWTFNTLNTGTRPIQRMGLNLGAPGDRKAADGTLWLEYPVVGGPSPTVTVQTQPETPEWYTGHSSRFQVGPQGGSTWVGASGGKGIQRLSISLPGRQRYTIRLHFAEPEALKPGQRRFQVIVQGKVAVQSLDVVARAGGPRRTLVQTVANVEVDEQLEIQLQAAQGSLPPILSGVELVVEPVSSGSR